MMVNSKSNRIAARILVVILTAIVAVPVMDFMNISESDVHASDLAGMENYPGVKHFNFASKEERSNVDEDCMIDPYYSIKMEKTMPDEYFGAKTVQAKDVVTGEIVTGFMLGNITAKNECGAICHKMFQYEGKWIDVKTTYVDWNVGAPRTAFFGGGFTRQRWRGVYWVEMRHEFFLAGTDTPVEIKGFQNYNDVDDYQGVMLEQSKVDDIWINYRDTALAYTNIPADTDCFLEDGAPFKSGKDMLYVQEVSQMDIEEEGNAGYDAEEAAKHCIGFTFSASEINTCIVDDSPSGLNILESGHYKFIPSATPEQGTPLVAKKVADNDEEKCESNSVNPEEEWTYYVNAFVPEETESYNFYDSFRIEDQIDVNLDIKDVRITRNGERATDLFTITQKDNLVTATAIDVGTKTFYGYDYILEIVVELGADRENLEEADLIDENCCYKVPNQASAVYGTGKEDKEIPTNETVTTVQFEKKGDIVITKEILHSDIHWPHGEITFLFNLKGTTSQGEEKEYNRYISFPEEYVTNNTGTEGTIRRSVTFEDVPEGEYICSEYATLRYKTIEVRELTGGIREGDTVVFTIDGAGECAATFRNEKSDWSDYSHSSIVVNRIGKGEQ